MRMLKPSLQLILSIVILTLAQYIVLNSVHVVLIRQMNLLARMDWRKVLKCVVGRDSAPGALEI